MTTRETSWQRAVRSHESCERASCARKVRSYGRVFGSRRVCAHTPHTPRVCAATAATHVWARSARSHGERRKPASGDSDRLVTVPPWPVQAGRRRGNARRRRQSLFVPSERPPTAATGRVGGQRGRRGPRAWYRRTTRPRPTRRGVPVAATWRAQAAAPWPGQAPHGVASQGNAWRSGRSASARAGLTWRSGRDERGDVAD